MNTLDTWVVTLQDALGLPPTDRDLILDMARDAAHGIARPAAPLTTYLLGLAAGRTGAEPAVLAAQIRELIAAFPPAETT